MQSSLHTVGCFFHQYFGGIKMIIVTKNDVTKQQIDAIAHELSEKGLILQSVHFREYVP